MHENGSQPLLTSLMLFMGIQAQQEARSPDELHIEGIRGMNHGDPSKVGAHLAKEAMGRMFERKGLDWNKMRMTPDEAAAFSAECERLKKEQRKSGRVRQQK